MKILPSLFRAATLSLALGATIASAAVPWLTTSGNQIRDPNGNRVILRGISLIDLSAQQVNYGGINSLIDRITNKNDTQGSSPGWYPKVLRLPCVPPGYGMPSSWQPGSDTYYNNILRPTVDYCKSKDVYCIIDLHYIENISINPTYVNQFWTYMAQHFANDTNVIFELFNEPINNSGTDDQKWATVRSYMQTWYNTVRTYAPNNLILVGTPVWSQVLTPILNNPISGNRVAYVVHTYPAHWASQYNRNQITSVANSIPLFMTEWGFTQTSDSLLNGSISTYGQPLMNTLDQYGISWTCWVANTEWAPPMFYSNWSLRVGPNEMGGFVKDTLYAKRNDNQPGGSGGGGGGTTPANGTFKLTNRNSGKVLDVSGNGTANGTQVLQWTYGGGNNQKWTLQDRGSSQFSIMGVASGKALDVNNYSSANGTKIQIWTYSGGNNQKWTFAATSSGYYRVTPVHATGSCLEISGNSTADGAVAQLWSYLGSNSQQWSLSAP
ncbi:MAG TPA: cellulase family glycosylhydrolase [Opitutaceae bacterium]|nr:cellulase family glycosylhydrolase [Opitutaceae bacterium]